MNRKAATDTFEKNACAYDKQRTTLAPIKDALHLCIQIILSELPADAQILCVGAGTGAELLYLAKAYPNWTFTVVEPASQMMTLCRQHVEKCGIASRCTFHEGYLKSLADCGSFDAATSILVSHFIVDETERIHYYSNMAKFIRPGGYLVTADLSADILASNYNELLNVWVNMHDYAGMPANIDSFGRDVAILPTDSIEKILIAGGFTNPVLFYQAMFIRAWFSRISPLSSGENFS